jgi:hypothetical protein
VNHVPHDFESIGNARTGAVEEPVAVGQKQAICFDGLETVETGALREPVYFGASAGKIESAGGDDDDVGVVREKSLPCDPRRVDARLSEDIDAAREVD